MRPQKLHLLKGDALIGYLPYSRPPRRNVMNGWQASYGLADLLLFHAAFVHVRGEPVSGLFELKPVRCIRLEDEFILLTRFPRI
jgi:hypothetical protein